MKGDRNSMNRFFFSMGAVSGFLGVAAGAFGAHALKGRLNAEMLGVFETAARYQMYHALALLGAAWGSSNWPGPLASGSAWLFLSGTVLFSGSLYALSLTGMTAFGAITPIGGLLLLAGWICLALAPLKGNT
jgi:uncharacterized membrane protein YgdD (TMEM256/DUF423 family)